MSRLAHYIVDGRLKMPEWYDLPEWYDKARHASGQDPFVRVDLIYGPSAEWIEDLILLRDVLNWDVLCCDDSERRLFGYQGSGPGGMHLIRLYIPVDRLRSDMPAATAAARKAFQLANQESPAWHPGLSLMTASGRQAFATILQAIGTREPSSRYDLIGSDDWLSP